MDLIELFWNIIEAESVKFRFLCNTDRLIFIACTIFISFGIDWYTTWSNINYQRIDDRRKVQPICACCWIENVEITNIWESF